MPKDERGFIYGSGSGVTIQLPPFLSMIKYLLITLIFYPWCAILFKSGRIEKIMGYIGFDGRNLSDSCTCGTSGK